MNTKICKRCNQEKLLEEFHKNSSYKDKKDSRCKLCIQEQKREWYSNNREYAQAYSRQYSQNNRHYDRKSKLKKKYGMTLEDYNRLYNGQQGLCKICKKMPIGNGSKYNYLDVDHCHRTGKVRGLLCSNCNLGLGNFQDNPDLLRVAIDYLAMQPAH